MEAMRIKTTLNDSKFSFTLPKIFFFCDKKSGNYSAHH